MDALLNIRSLPVAAVVWTGVALAWACNTSSNTPAGGSSSSSATGNTSETSAAGASAAGNASSGRATQTTSGSSSTSVTAVCTPMPVADGGFSPLVTFSQQCNPPVDGGTCFGAYPVLYGGTYSYAGTTDSMPNEAGVGCATYGSTSHLSASVDTDAGTWNFTGTVGTFAGGGIYIGPCVNASAFTGIQFTVYGNVGAADGGMGDQVQVQVSDLEDWGVPSAGGTCPLATDGGPLTACSPFTYSFSVSATAANGVVQVPFSALMGGGPDTKFDPAHIIQIQWQLPWPCTGGTPYMPDITMQNVGFYQ